MALQCADNIICSARLKENNWEDIMLSLLKSRWAH